MKYALLGDIQFEVIVFGGIESKFATDYAEHARIEGKPRLQWIGDKLDEHSLSLKFHFMFCDPDAEISKLYAAMSAHIALPFVLANGEYKGEFVIADIALSEEFTDAQGGRLSATVKVSLRESIGAAGAKPAAPGVAKFGKPRPPGAKNGLKGKAKPNLMAAKLKAAVIAGREMLAAVQAARNMMKLAKALQKNPLKAVEQLRHGVPGFSKIVTAADRFGVNLAPLQGSVDGSASMLAMSGSVAREAKSAMTLLGDVNEQNMNGRMNAVDTNLSVIGNEADATSPVLAKMAAKTAVRESV
ncbi:MAG: hypothetical protein FD173_934 [Gallionellaceae bacterium]|nr:MAG: hypothetical protein FD173_934 [Gallionellaceae bacterium]